MKVLSGNSAVAEAVRQVCPDFVAAYPIVPASSIYDEIAAFIADGRMDTEMINLESSRSAISALMGASASGGRVFGASASQGLASMHELLFTASAFRLPIVQAVTNRALAAPVNYHADHSDSMAQRDCGWIQLYSENIQEVYDNLIQAFKIAEHPDVQTPVMVCLDGIVTSHTLANVMVEKNSEISDFAGKRTPVRSMLDFDNPRTFGSVDMPDYYFEHKVNQRMGHEAAGKIIRSVGKEFGDRFGRYYGNFECYKLEDAQYAFMLLNSAAGTAKEAVDELRSAGEKVGLLKLRSFRPFPHKELMETLSHVKALAVLERSLMPGTYGGPLFNETRSALYDLDSEKRPLVFSYIYGLGGRNISLDHFRELYRDMCEKSREDVDASATSSFINLRHSGEETSEGG